MMTHSTSSSTTQSGRPWWMRPQGEQVHLVWQVGGARRYRSPGVRFWEKRRVTGYSGRPPHGGGHTVRCLARLG